MEKYSNKISSREFTINNYCKILNTKSALFSKNILLDSKKIFSIYKNKYKLYNYLLNHILTLNSDIISNKNLALGTNYISYICSFKELILFLKLYQIIDTDKKINKLDILRFGITNLEENLKILLK